MVLGGLLGKVGTRLKVQVQGVDCGGDSVEPDDGCKACYSNTRKGDLNVCNLRDPNCEEVACDTCRRCNFVGRRVVWRMIMRVAECEGG